MTLLLYVIGAICATVVAVTLFGVCYLLNPKGKTGTEKIDFFLFYAVLFLVSGNFIFLLFEFSSLLKYVVFSYSGGAL